jgi:hypothetical protein
MTIDEVNDSFTGPGAYYLTLHCNGRSTSRVAFICGVYEAGQYKQVRGQAAPVITTSDEIFLVSNVSALSPYAAEVEATGEPVNARQRSHCLPSDYWMG